MQTIEKQQNNYTIKYLVISHIFNNFENIICSGSKIYQLPCIKNLRSYGLKELKPKYHLGMQIYLIDTKRISSKRLKENAIKVNKLFEIERFEFCPF